MRCLSRRPPPLLAASLFLLALLHSGLAPAGVVSLTAPNGREATAEYRPGRSDLPAVLIVHGFLQTRAFPTVAALADGLAQAGFTVLTPTLTLNVSRRKHSLPCEAVHSHTFEMDVAEVAAWADWLERKGHRRVVLIGHSHGALAILPVLARPPAAVKQAILVGLTDVRQEYTLEERQALVRELKARIARGDRSLVTASYTFCRKYVGPPEAVLSFVGLTREDVLRWLAASRVPTRVILGERDERLGPDWAAVLRGAGVRVEVLPGASHFFDGTAELDLHDRIVQSLGRRGE